MAFMRLEFSKYFKEILLSLIYCNWDTLQYEFSKTYRVNIWSHEEFYHLGKNLTISINKFGSKLHASADVKCYHGINVQLSFPVYIGQNKNNGPLSTTTSFEVALNFANYRGLIVEFSDSCGFSKSYSMQWLSDWTNEKEHLFMQNPGRLQIQNIANVSEGTDYHIIIHALRHIDEIMRSTNWNNDSAKQMKYLIHAIISDTSVSNCISQQQIQSILIFR
eukprot:453359_1